MANKKILMSVTASAAIAAAIYSAEDAEAASYKVKSGDTLSGIAQQHDTSVKQLKSINDLTTTIIYPDQVLKTDSDDAADDDSSTSAKANHNNDKKQTYTVESGDTLSGIAHSHDVSVADLKKWNDLTSSLIHPGDQLAVAAENDTNESESSHDEGAKNESSTSGNNANESSGDVHTVESGDTLSGIASRYNVSVKRLKRWNNLSSDLILVGQKLSIGADASSGGSDDTDSSASDFSHSGTPGSDKSGVDTDYDVDELISVAKSLEGTPYVWGGSTTSGFDCSGFIQYTYNQAGKDLSRLSSAGYHQRAQYVNDPQVGDLVFFENTYEGANGISHMGIYLGDGNFIHAGSDGVAISNVNTDYWQQYFDSFKRFY